MIIYQLTIVSYLSKQGLRYMKKMFLITLLPLVVLLSGCGQTAPKPRAMLHLNSIDTSESAKKIGKTIIVLKASVKMINTKNTDRMDIRSQIIRMQEGITGGDYDFNKAYKYKFGSRAANALKDDICDILTNTPPQNFQTTF
jgi:hypothetical protein